MKNRIDISVIVCIYNASIEKLQKTLDSILIQQNCNYEIIICDDGSKILHKEWIDNYILEHRLKVKTIYNSINQGTVKNIFSGITVAEGKYIKPIGQGDYLMNAQALHTVVKYMEQRNSAIAFSDMVLFDEGRPKEFRDSFFPFHKQHYIKYDQKKILRDVFYNYDTLCGCSLFYRKAELQCLLNKMVGKIKFCEDYVAQLFLLEGYQIGYIGEKLVAYEFGTGISAGRRLTPDDESLSQLLFEEYPDNKYAIFRYKYWKISRNKHHLVRTGRFVYRFFCNPQSAVYLLQYRMRKDKI